MKKQVILFLCILLTSVNSMANVIGTDNYGVKYSLDTEVHTASVVYNNNSGIVDIPSMVSYNNTIYSVTSIDEGAFKNCTDLFDIRIPNSVTSIGEYAFNGCSRLKTIIIPNSVKSIGKGAFGNCSKLKSFVFPNQITTICSNVLENCKLSSIIIPSSVTIIEQQAFANCTSVSDVYCFMEIVPQINSLGLFNKSTSNITWHVAPTLVDSYNKTLGQIVALTEEDRRLYPHLVEVGELCYWLEQGHAGVAFMTDDTYSGDFVIPAEIKNEGYTYPVKSILQSAFFNCDVTSITIPNSVTTLEWCAFKGCDNLKSIIIPNSIQNINTYGLFYRCINLTSVTLPDNLTTIESAMFFSCQSLSSITIPNSVTYIGGSSFQNCRSLTSITIPNSVEEINGYAFAYCSGLTSVYMEAETPPILVEGYEDYTFYEISPKCELYVPSVENYQSWSKYFGGGIKFGFIGSGIQFVSSTETLKGIGKTITLEPIITDSSIKEENLIWESSDNSIATVSNNGVVTSKNYGIATISCRYNNVGATCRVIVYNENLIYIGNIFYGLSELNAYVTNCAGGKPSDERVREEYRGTVNIPASITYDGKNYPVTSVGEYAFFNMKELQAVVVPTSVLKFEDHSFEKSENLARVAFMDKDQGLLSVGKYAFSECAKLSTITLPNSTQRIDNSAFRACPILSSVSLGTSLNYIEEFAFANCTSLNNITLPESLKSIQNAAFLNDEALTSISYPAGLEGIGASAFSNCKALTDVTFTTSNYSLTVGENAFLGSDAISRVIVKNLDAWVCINFSNPAANPVSISKRLYNTDGKVILDAVVPEGPLYVGNNVFYNCESLYSITLPSTIQFVNDNIIYGCSSLKKVLIMAKEPPIFVGTADPSTMNSVFNSATLYVPANSIGSYKADDFWKRFSAICDLAAPVSSLEYDSKASAISNYSFDGKLNYTPKSGLTIIRTSDGKTRKVIVK